MPLIAVAVKRKVVGSLLRGDVIKTVKREGYSEVIFFSGETYKDSWNFHDATGFERVGPMSAPNGEGGSVWWLVL